MMSLALREILVQELAARKNKNRRYSLRAMAAYFKLKPGQLSKIINGKVQPTKQTVDKILSRLDFDDTEKERILKLNEESIRIKKDKYLKGRNEFFTSSTQPELIAFIEESDISVFLSLGLPQVQNDVMVLCKLLNRTPEELRASLDRLLSARIIEERDGSFFKLVPQVTDVQEQSTNISKMRLQQKFLERAIRAIETVDAAQRLNGTLTVTLDQDLVPKIKSKIDNFLRDLNGMIMAESKKMDAIYNFSVALCPMEKLEKNNNEKENVDN